MKTILCIICLSLLVSCSDYTKRPKDIAYAEKLCESNGGIAEVQRLFFPPGIDRLEVWCLNGARFEIGDQIVYRDFTKKPLTTPKE